MKTALIVCLGVWVFTVVSADECIRDYADDNGNKCEGKSLRRVVSPKLTVCCEGSGRMSYSTKTSSRGTTTKCTCTGPSPSSGSIRPSKEQGGPPKAVGKVSLEDFRQQALERHNELRALHGSPALKLSDDLNAYAQKWAENMARKHSMYHSNRTMSSGEKLGENVAYRSSSAGADFSGDEPVQMWYDEISLYDFNRANGQHGTGHFTQVVWKDTTELGMGKAFSADGKSVFACGSYRGPGNVQVYDVHGVFRDDLWKANVPTLVLDQ